MYEIVRLHHTSLRDTQQYKDYRFSNLAFSTLNSFPSNAHYRVDVKRRLNAPFQKEQVCFYFRTNYVCEASIELNSL